MYYNYIDCHILHTASPYMYACNIFNSIRLKPTKIIIHTMKSQLCSWSSNHNYNDKKKRLYNGINLKSIANTQYISTTVGVHCFYPALF